MADALSRKNNLLTVLRAQIGDFEGIKGLYSDDADFSNYWHSCVFGKEVKDYHIQDGFLFYKNRLCIPVNPLRQKLICSLHS